MEDMQNKKEAYQQRISRLRGVWSNYQHKQEEQERKNPRQVIFNALGGKEAPLNASEKVNLVQKLLYSSEDENIHDGKSEKKLSEFANELAATIEKDTFYFEQANSIERINCETSTMNEYFTWIDEGQAIIQHMNDGSVTQNDVNERDGFLDMSFQRETELLTCLGLYERSMKAGNAEAKVKYDELRLKLQKLREIRSSIQATCSHEVDKKIERQQYDRAVAYFHLLALMRQMGVRPSSAQLEEFRGSSVTLNVYHGGDAELLPGYSFYTRMLEDVRHADDRESSQSGNGFNHSLSYNRSPGEFLYMVRHADAREEDIRTRIQRLRGLRPLSNSYSGYDTAQMRQRSLTREGIQSAMQRYSRQNMLDRA